MRKVDLRPLLWLVAAAFLFACQKQEPIPLHPKDNPNASTSTTTGTYEAEQALKIPRGLRQYHRFVRPA